LRTKWISVRLRRVISCHLNGSGCYGWLCYTPTVVGTLKGLLNSHHVRQIVGRELGDNRQVLLKVVVSEILA
jgi:hypothetical protein